MEQTVNITYWLDELKKAAPIAGYVNEDRETKTITVTHNKYNRHFYKSSGLVHYEAVEVFVDRMARALNLKAQDREQELKAVVNQRDNQIAALNNLQYSHDNEIVHKNIVINSLRADLKTGQARYQVLSQQYDAKVNRLANVGIDLAVKTRASFQLKRENAELREAAAELKRELRALKEQHRIQGNNICYLRDALGKSIPDTRRAVQAKPEIQNVKPATFGVQPHSVGCTYPLIIVSGVAPYYGTTKNVWWVRFGELESVRYNNQKTAELVANKFATLIQTEGWDKAKAYFDKCYADNGRS